MRNTLERMSHMSHIGPDIQPQFHTLSPALQEAILKKDVTLNTLDDLIRCLETIASGAQ